MRCTLGEQCPNLRCAEPSTGVSALPDHLLEKIASFLGLHAYRSFCCCNKSLLHLLWTDTRSRDAAEALHEEFRAKIEAKAQYIEGNLVQTVQVRANVLHKSSQLCCTAGFQWQVCRMLPAAQHHALQ